MASIVRAAAGFLLSWWVYPALIVAMTFATVGMAIGLASPWPDIALRVLAFTFMMAMIYHQRMRRTADFPREVRSLAQRELIKTIAPWVILFAVAVVVGVFIIFV